MFTLLYGSEYWRITESIITRLSVLHAKNLKRILLVFWPDTISNQQLITRCNQDSMETSSCEGDGDGLGTSWGESRTTSLAQSFNGHLKESARGDDQETACAELWGQSSRPCNTLAIVTIAITPQLLLWNTTGWLLTVIAFGSAYSGVYRPVYLVAFRSDSRQVCSVSQASLDRPRKTECLLFHVCFPCRN